MADNVNNLHGEEDAMELERGFDRTMASKDAVPDEPLEHSPEKADEYFENLAEDDLAQIEQEVEAEEALRVKREKDKENARKKDKRAFKDAHDKYERDMAETNRRRAQLEEAQRTEGRQIHNRQDSTATALPSSPVLSNYTTPDPSASYAYEQGSFGTGHPEPSTQNYPNAYTEAENRRREQVEEAAEIQRRNQQAQNEAFFEQMNQAARERQQAAENYESIGSSGIDFSGKNQHAVHENAGAQSSPLPRIEESDYSRLRTNYEDTRTLFRSYGDQVPEAVATQYQEATEKFFSVQRQVDQGTMILYKSVDNDSMQRQESVAGGSGYKITDSSSKSFIAGADHENSSFSVNPTNPSTNGQHPNVVHSSPAPTDSRHVQINNPIKHLNTSVYNPLYQHMARQANSAYTAYVASQTSPNGADTTQGKSPSTRPSNGSEVISQARYDNLQRLHTEAQKEIASYNGKDIPQAVSVKAEKIEQLFSAVQEKINNGRLTVGADSTATKSFQSVTPKNNNANDVSVARGTEAFSDKSKINYAPDSKRVGDSHIKPVGTPFQASPISKYDKLKIYHAHDFAKPFEAATGGTYRAIGSAVLMAARYEQTGAANTAISARDHARTAAAAMKTLTDAPRQIQAAYQTASNAALAVRNCGRFLQGKEAIQKEGGKPLTIRQIDKELKNPFTSTEKTKLGKKFGEDINARAASIRNKTIIQTAKCKNLKAEIKALQEKGSALTSAERKHLKNLMEQKKLADAQLRKTHGLKNAREQAINRNKQTDFLGKKSADKTIKQTQKKKLRLSKEESNKLTRIKDRADLLNKRNKLQKAAMARKQLLSSLGGILGKAARESEESSVRSLLGASRVVQNRYVRVILKYSAKAALMPAMLAKKTAVVGYKLGRFVDAKFNQGKIGAKIDHGVDAVKSANRLVKKTFNKAEEAAVRKILHSRPYKALNGGLYNKAKAKIKAKTPERIKTLAKKGVSKVSTINKKRQAILKRFNNLKDRLAKSRLGRFASSLGKGFKGLSKALGFIKKLAVKFALIVGGFLILVTLIGGFLTAAGGASGSLVLGDDSSDGRIDLKSYIDTLNNEQKALNTIVTGHKENTEANNGIYRRVYVDYLGNNNNYREILSMAAVYFDQDFTNGQAVNDYIVALFNASNYVTTSESSKYYCSGCVERDYRCYDEYDEFATATRISLYEKSDHSNEANVGGAYSTQHGCTKSALYSCMEYGHGTYNRKGCYQHNHGDWMDDPEKWECDNYSKAVANPIRMPGEEVYYHYRCKGHCSGQHYDYSCPGHTEKVCYGHIDLYVNVACLGFDKLFNVDSSVTVGKDYGSYTQGGLLGKFNITYYCAEKYPHICNAGPPYKTASGTVVTAGRTIAVDPDVIPLETPVIINGHLYVAEDTGGAIKGNRIDIAVATHQEALNLGRDVFNVYLATESSEEESEPEIQRKAISYISKAETIVDPGLTVNLAMEIFGAAKDPVCSWNYNAYAGGVDTAESFQTKLQDFDSQHLNTPYTNAELNAFEYIKMDAESLRKLCVDRGIDLPDKISVYSIITEYLIPHDKEHPNLYVNPKDDPNNVESNQEFYFAGWDETNKEWAKTILENMTSENYSGLDDILGNSGVDNNVSLDGLVIQGSKINVTYYSQKDPRWANQPIRPDAPENTIRTSGCGFTSMSIVVSSLTNTTIDPPGICATYGTTHYSIGQGAYHSLISDVSRDYGLNCTELLNSDVQGVIDALKEGKLVVALLGRGGYGWTGNGYYAGNGHFVVICGISEDGGLLLADPNRPDVAQSGQSIGLEYFIASGIKKFWAIGK